MNVRNHPQGKPTPMPMLKYALIVIVIVGSFASLHAQTDKLHFRANVTEMSPMGMSPRMVTDYSLTIHGDSVDVYLPYIGEVYSYIPDQDGMTFNVRYKDLAVERKAEKHRTDISFSATCNTVFYKFYITAFENKRFDMTIQPSNAQGCSYSGTWEQ